MTEKQRGVLRFAISLGLMAAFVHWAIGDLDLWAVWAAIGQVSLSSVLLILLITLGTLFLRGWRWVVLMRHFAPQVTICDACKALAICYAGNLAFPRAGEALRVLSLSWTRGAPKSPVAATVVVERFLDLLWLVIFMGIALVLFRSEIGGAWPGLEMLSLAVLLGCVGVLVFFGYVSLYTDRAVKLIGRVFDRVLPRLTRPVTGLLEAFIHGLAALRRPGTYLELVVSSLLLNLGYVFIIHASLIGMGFGEPYGIGFAAAIAVMAVSSIGVIVPIQGGIGTYHLCFKWALTQVFLVAPAEALACATVVHALSTLLYVVMGTPLLLWQYLRRHSKPEQPEEE